MLLNVRQTVTAKEIYVDQNATGADDGSNWSDAFTSLPKAIAEANLTPSGDDIILSAGTYSPVLSQVVTAPCVVRGTTGVTIYKDSAVCAFEILFTNIHFFDVAFDGTAPKVNAQGGNMRFDRCEFRNCEKTCIEGNACNAMEFRDCVFANNGFEHTQHEEGAAVVGRDCRQVLLDGCDLLQNRVRQCGGAVFLDGCADVRFVSCVFSENSTYMERDSFWAGDKNGGAVYCHEYETVLFNRCEFDHNQAFYEGGAVALREGQISEFYDCNFINNDIIECGGAIGVRSFDVIGNCIVRNCTFGQNMMGIAGGAIWGCGHLDIRKSLFTGNSGRHDGSLAGGAVNWCGSLDMNECVLENNQSGERGGALNVYGNWRFVPDISVQNSVFKSNKSQNGGAIACDLDEGWTANLVNNVVVDNTADAGGGIYLCCPASGGPGTLSLCNCTVANNRAIQAGGIFIDQLWIAVPDCELYNTILWGNRDTTSRLPIREQINRPPLWAAQCCVEDPTGASALWGTGIINADPKMRTEGSLGVRSPCIDAGDLTLFPSANVAAELDVVGNPRVIGPEIDMGAFENNRSGGFQPLSGFEPLSFGD